MCFPIYQVLTSSVVMRGTVYPGTQYDVSASGSATQLYISKLDVAVGDTVANGQVLAEIDGAPMFVLTGSVPAWRDLTPGESGPDVAELQQALAALGYGRGGDASGYFGTGTEHAVSSYYEHLGYPVPTTGATTAQAVDAAEKAVTADKIQVSQAEVGPSTSQSEQQLSADRSQLSADESALSAAEAVNGPEVPQGDVVFLPSLPSTVIALNGVVGQQAGSPFLELASGGSLALTGQLPPSYASQIKTGLAVKIFDEATGLSATGTVTAVGQPTENVPTGTTVTMGGSTGGSGSAGNSNAGSSASGSSANTSSALFVPVTVNPASPLPAAMNGHNVLVTVETGQTEGAVLTVPVAAIVTTASGASFVTVVGAGGKQTTVPVTAGMSDNGDVQVAPTTPGSLTVGENVLVSG